MFLSLSVSECKIKRPNFFPQIQDFFFFFSSLNFFLLLIIIWVGSDLRETKKTKDNFFLLPTHTFSLWGAYKLNNCIEARKPMPIPEPATAKVSSIYFIIIMVK